MRTFKGLGIFLNEIINKEIPMRPDFLCEPNWSIKRFTDLQGNLLKINEVLESLKK